MWRADLFEKTLMERLRAGGEGDGRGWDDWMVPPTQWTWVWVNSWSWWWTGRPGTLLFMGSQRVGHDGVTELNWTNSWFTMFCEFLLYRKLLPLSVCVYIYIYIYIYVLSSVLVFTRYWVKFHVLYNRILLFSHLVYEFASANPTLPVNPYSTPQATTNLFSMSVNLFLLCR